MKFVQFYQNLIKEVKNMDIRHLSEEACPECGSNKLVTDGKITWCSEPKCNWVKPYKTAEKPTEAAKE